MYRETNVNKVLYQTLITTNLNFKSAKIKEDEQISQ